MKQLVEDRPGGSALRERGERRPTSPAPGDSDTPNGVRQRYPQHALIFLEGDPAQRIFELCEGTAMLYKLLPDGRRQVVELLKPGDVFGFTALPIHDCSAESLWPVTVMAYDRAQIERAPAFMARLHQRVHVQICRMHEHAMLLGRKSALERVASYLVRLVPDRSGPGCAGRAGSDDHAMIRLPMTRQEIADYLGLTIETVSRAFSELRRRKVVTLGRLDEVRINDVCGLCRLTGLH